MTLWLSEKVLTQLRFDGQNISCEMILDIIAKFKKTNWESFQKIFSKDLEDLEWVNIWNVVIALESNNLPSLVSPLSHKIRVLSLDEIDKQNYYLSEVDRQAYDYCLNILNVLFWSNLDSEIKKIRK